MSSVQRIVSNADSKVHKHHADRVVPYDEQDEVCSGEDTSEETGSATDHFLEAFYLDGVEESSTDEDSDAGVYDLYAYSAGSRSPTSSSSSYSSANLPHTPCFTEDTFENQLNLAFARHDAKPPRWDDLEDDEEGDQDTDRPLAERLQSGMSSFNSSPLYESKHEHGAGAEANELRR